MVSVALDIFRLPFVLSRGKSFDSVSVCVDRHSGWIVAVPCLNKGVDRCFCGTENAQVAVETFWGPFSDQK